MEYGLNVILFLVIKERIHLLHFHPTPEKFVEFCDILLIARYIRQIKSTNGTNIIFTANKVDTADATRLRINDLKDRPKKGFKLLVKHDIALITQKTGVKVIYIFKQVGVNKLSVFSLDFMTQNGVNFKSGSRAIFLTVF
jgi:hypothetical protein